MQFTQLIYVVVLGTSGLVAAAPPPATIGFIATDHQGGLISARSMQCNPADDCIRFCCPYEVVKTPLHRGLAPEPYKECFSSSDCFDGFECVNGRCRLAPPKASDNQE
ncbi:hypothetical protein DFH09DRAFT_1366254 [Mycena vulgaris]|nr:hypothetical protein DFH09DRAFT_1366254 [Mycena vulgaris]